MAEHSLRIRPVGEGARLVELGEVGPETTALARALANRLLDEPLPGLLDVLPAYRTVLIRFDSCRIAGEDVDTRVRGALEDLECIPHGEGRIVEIPVCYGNEYGPDLEDVAAHVGLSPDEVVRRHTEVLYRVEFLGFSPGFPFLSGLPPALATPRLSTPRTRVPAGSVAIGGPQTGFYPLPSPGGWRLIGRVLDLGFDPARPETLPYGPGDRIRFIPVPANRLTAPRSPALDTGWSEPHEAPGRADLDAAAPAKSLSTPTVESDEAASPEHRSSASGAPVGGETAPANQPTLLVLRPGPYTTVQDLGRIGLARMGYAPAGAMDRAAFQTANALVGNPTGAAALEIALAGAEFEAAGDLTIAVTGADLTPILAGEPLSLYRAASMRAGMRLRFAAPRHAMRAYLAVAGGIAVPEVLGSRATDLVGGIGGMQARLLQAGDCLLVGAREGPVMGYALAGPPPNPVSPITLRVVWGPEDDWFSEKTRSLLVSTTFRISDRGDRTGVRLLGELLLPTTARSLASEGAVPGAIQVPPDGQPIVLLADSRGVGGYPKIAVVIEADLDLPAQAAPGTLVRFEAVSETAARRLARAYRASLAALPLRPLPELSVRCLREIGAADPLPCPRTFDCLVSRRCSLITR
jgi:antagonist of KipI